MYKRPKQQANLHGYHAHAYESQVEPWHPLSYYLSGGADVDGVTKGVTNRRFDNPEDIDEGVVDKSCSFKEDSFSLIEEAGRIQAELLKKENEEH